MRDIFDPPLPLCHALDLMPYHHTLPYPLPLLVWRHLWLVLIKTQLLQLEPKAKVSYGTTLLLLRGLNIEIAIQICSDNALKISHFKRLPPPLSLVHFYFRIFFCQTATTYWLVEKLGPSIFSNSSKNSDPSPKYFFSSACSRRPRRRWSTRSQCWSASRPWTFCCSNSQCRRL